uniref:Uncharacterized protein n=1 Tax=Leersia perrieri TaxID=77586 RepID=A0A0D9W5N3_9ORYZ
MLEVADDTRSSFCVSLWPKHGSSVLAGDVLLLQNIKIVEFRNGLEGRASQISAVQVFLNSKDLKERGIDELIDNCKVGDNTRSKLRRVVEWAWMQHNKCALAENCHKATLKNWKDRKEKELGEFLSISELLPQSKLCNIGIYAFVCKMVLTGSLTSDSNRKFSVIERFSLKEHNDIVRDLVTTGCTLCGSPLYPKYAPYIANVSPAIYMYKDICFHCHDIVNLYAETFMENPLIPLTAQKVQNTFMLLARYTNPS